MSQDRSIIFHTEYVNLGKYCTISNFDVSNNTIFNDDGIISLDTDTTISQEGHTKLTDSVSSTSIDTAATPNSVKIVNDKIEQEIDDVITHEQIDSLFL